MDRIQILLFAFFALGLAWLAWQGAKVWMRRGIRAGAGEVDNRFPTLLYFSGDHCSPCRLQQAPIFDSLRQSLGSRARFQEYDAVENPDLARQYRVLTVPTTVVVAPDGDVVAVNYGVTQAEKLRHQLNEAARLAA